MLGTVCFIQLSTECRNVGRHLVDAATSRREHRVLEGRQLVLLGLINQRTEDLATLHGAAGVACNAVSPAEEHGALAEVEERLHVSWAWSRMAFEWGPPKLWLPPSSSPVTRWTCIKRAQDSYHDCPQR